MGLPEFTGLSASLVRIDRVDQKAAGADTAAKQEALGRLCQTYWLPVYAFVRKRGHTPEAAKDLTQDFLLIFWNEIPSRGQ